MPDDYELERTPAPSWIIGLALLILIAGVAVAFLAVSKAQFLATGSVLAQYQACSLGDQGDTQSVECDLTTDGSSQGFGPRNAHASLDIQADLPQANSLVAPLVAIGSVIVLAGVLLSIVDASRREKVKIPPPSEAFLATGVPAVAEVLKALAAAAADLLKSARAPTAAVLAGALLVVVAAYMGMQTSIVEVLKEAPAVTLPTGIDSTTSIATTTTIASATTTTEANPDPN